MSQFCPTCDGGRIKFSLGGFKTKCPTCRNTGVIASVAHSDASKLIDAQNIDKTIALLEEAEKKLESLTEKEPKRGRKPKQTEPN